MKYWGSNQMKNIIDLKFFSSSLEYIHSKFSEIYETRRHVQPTSNGHTLSLREHNSRLITSCELCGHTFVSFSNNFFSPPYPYAIYTLFNCILIMQFQSSVLYYFQDVKRHTEKPATTIHNTHTTHSYQFYSVMNVIIQIHTTT